MNFSAFLVVIVLHCCVQGTTAALPYDDEVALVVDISIDSEIWEKLRVEKRDLTSQWFSCSRPFDNPYVWQKSTVSVDGEVLTDVGIRKKGFYGSVESTAPSLKLDSDKFVDDQEFDDGTEHVTLNNNKQDTSRIFTCLAYDIFKSAGYPASECNQAVVKINGQQLDNRIYTHVEPIKKSFLKKNFDDHTGNLYEGTLADFYSEQLPKGSETRWEIKRGDEEDTLVSPFLQSISDVLKNSADEDLAQDLFALINREMFFKFWALEILCGLKDGYTSNRNNFYLYSDPSNDNKAVFLPWGPDRFTDRGAALFVYGEIPRRLSRIGMYRDELRAAMQDVLDTFNVETLWNNVETRINSVFSSGGSFTLEEKHAQLHVKNWLLRREKTVLESLEKKHDHQWVGLRVRQECESVRILKFAAGIGGASVTFAGVAVVFFLFL